MTKFLAAFAAIAALSAPVAVSAQDSSAEMQARIKAAESSEGNEQTIYINGRLFDAEQGSYVFGDDGSVYIRTGSNYNLAPHNPDLDGEVAGTLTATEIRNLCAGQEPDAKTGLPCESQ